MDEATVDHRQLALGETQDSAEADLHTVLRIDALLGGHRYWLGAEDPARYVHAVAAYVHQRAALQGFVQPDVQTTGFAGWIDDVAERGAHEAWLADRTVVQ